MWLAIGIIVIILVLVNISDSVDKNTQAIVSSNAAKVSDVDGYERKEFFSGVANNFELNGQNVLHAFEDCTVNFDFGNGNIQTVDMKADDDVFIGHGCKTITSTSRVSIL